MLPEACEEYDPDVHIVSLGGGTVMVQPAVKPSSVILLSLVNCRNISPDVATRSLGRASPVNVPSKTPEAFTPSYTLNLSQLSSTLKVENVNTMEAEGTPEDIRKVQFSLFP
jgi:hypothetical protein